MADVQMASDVQPSLRIDFPVSGLRAICEKWNVKRLGLFGSCVRGDFTESSDVDVLYKFVEGHSLGWNIVDFHEELSELFGGRDVDLVNFDCIYWRIKDRVLDDCVVVYERQ